MDVKVKSFQESISVDCVYRSRSSLLIPNGLRDFYTEQCSHHGSQGAFFSFVVLNFLPELSKHHKFVNSRKDPSWKVAYQKNGQNLLKKSFLPNPAEWECFRHAASAAGVSMCFLFVIILTLAMQGAFLDGPQKSPLARNSIPESESNQFYLRKFSFLERKIDIKKGEMQRKHTYS